MIGGGEKEEQSISWVDVERSDNPFHPLAEFRIPEQLYLHGDSLVNGSL
jgi:hypothetical protein